MNLQKYLEVLLDGFGQVYSDKNTSEDKFYVRQIENGKEFDGIQDEARGVIVAGNLYMMTKTNNAIHRRLWEFLRKRGITIGPIGSDWADATDYKDLPQFLNVIKLGGNLLMGETYGWGIGRVGRDAEWSHVIFMTLGEPKSTIRKETELLAKRMIPDLDTLDTSAREQAIADIAEKVAKYQAALDKHLKVIDRLGIDYEMKFANG